MGGSVTDRTYVKELRSRDGDAGDCGTDPLTARGIPCGPDTAENRDNLSTEVSQTRVYNGVEFIVRFDGAHRNSDADLFSPVEFADDEPGKRIMARTPLRLREGSVKNQEAILAVMRDAWDTLTAIAARTGLSRDVARWALRTMIRRGSVESEQTQMMHLGKCVVVYRRKQTDDAR